MVEKSRTRDAGGNGRGGATRTAGPADSAAAGEDWAGMMASIAERSQRLVQDFVARNAANPAQAMSLGMADSLNIGGAFLELLTQMMATPHKLVDAHLSLWRDYMELWRSTTMRMMGQPAGPVIEPDREDRRFKDDAWRDVQVFDFIK